MHEISPRRSGGRVLPAARAAARASSFETRVVDIPREMSRSDARQLLAAEAEYGKWELTRMVLYRGGGRRAWLRRRVIRVRRSDLL